MDRTEEREQARLIKWTHRVAVRERMPELRWLHHSPNGGKRDAITGGQMKALGVKAGFPDLLLPVRNDQQQPGLVIEMKSTDGRTSPEQKEWLAHFDAQGYCTAVARSAEEARVLLCIYLGHNPSECPSLD